MRSCRRATGDPADTPEAPLQEKRRGELLRESLAKLSPEHSEVIDLVYYHGPLVGLNHFTVPLAMLVSYWNRSRNSVVRSTGNSKLPSMVR